MTKEETVMRYGGLLISVLGLGLASIGAKAEVWPAKPIRVIVPFGAGSAIDIIPRLVLNQSHR
jgi:tripartite-type tricarboxylate transporter receptor subunit TctC